MRLRSFAGLISGIILSILLTGCVQTSLVYDPNTYHTGRTGGKGKWKAQIIGGAGPTFHNTDDDPYFRTDHGAESFIATIGASAGLSDRLDLGSTFNIGIANDASSSGLRVYLKYMVTDTQATTSVSIMPAVVYISGSSEADDVGRKASSHLSALELHIPMSFQIAKHVSIVTEPKMLMLFHRARFEAGPQEYSVVSRTTKEDWICPAIAFGLTIGPVLPEVTFMSLDGSLKVLGGVGLNF